MAEKERIIRLEEETLRRHPPDLGEFASVLVTIVAEWRAGLRNEPPPPAVAEKIEIMEKALLRTLIEAGMLSRQIRDQVSVAAIGAQAHAVDEATAQVDKAIERLELEQCADLEVSPGSGTQR